MFVSHVDGRVIYFSTGFYTDVGQIIGWSLLLGNIVITEWLCTFWLARPRRFRKNDQPERVPVGVMVSSAVACRQTTPFLHNVDRSRHVLSSVFFPT